MIAGAERVARLVTWWRIVPGRKLLTTGRKRTERDERRRNRRNRRSRRNRKNKTNRRKRIVVSSQWSKEAGASRIRSRSCNRIQELLISHFIGSFCLTGAPVKPISSVLQDLLSI